jgi:hypothetical protein
MLPNSVCPEANLIVAREIVVVVLKEPAIWIDFIQVASATC